VTRFWANRTGLRVGIAIVAAYAVTLQMLLASIVPAQLPTGGTSSSGDFIICQHDPGVPPGRSIVHLKFNSRRVAAARRVKLARPRDDRRIYSGTGEREIPPS
jgi:hypothetical protein